MSRLRLTHTPTLFYLYTRYKLISSMKFEKVEKSYWNEERRFFPDPVSKREQFLLSP